GAKLLYVTPASHLLFWIPLKCLQPFAICFCVGCIYLSPSSHSVASIHVCRLNFHAKLSVRLSRRAGLHPPERRSVWTLATGCEINSRSNRALCCLPHDWRG